MKSIQKKYDNKVIQNNLLSYFAQDKFPLKCSHFFVIYLKEMTAGRWKGIVIWNLREDKKRFSELKRILVTINDKMLSQVLRELEEQGVVNRKVYEVVPPKVEYSPTDEGRKLLPIMQAMNDYGLKFQVE